jgi:hypothetical protein
LGEFFRRNLKCSYDPVPSILQYSISSIENSPGSQTPAPKRAKLSAPIPDTIGERLAAYTYNSFDLFLTDVSAVCKALLNVCLSSPKTNGQQQPIRPELGTIQAQVIAFQKIAKDLVLRDLARRITEIDLSADAVALHNFEVAKAPKAVLVVKTAKGPLFSSLPDNHYGPSAISSRSTSSFGSPKSPISTAATSAISSPRLKGQTSSVFPLSVELIPSMNATKAQDYGVTYDSEESKELKFGDSRPDLAPTKYDPPKPLKFAEAFPPLQLLVNLQPPKTDFKTVGLKWGGTIGPGGVPLNPSLKKKTENTGHWLHYTNFPRPGMSRLLPDPFRLGIGLPPNFVASYSTFAPTHDEGMAKVPQSLGNAMWWERQGGATFRKIFCDDPGVGHMFTQYEAQRPDVVETYADVLDVKTSPMTISDEANVGSSSESVSDELDDKRLEEMIENLDNLDENQLNKALDGIPIDLRLTEGGEAPSNEAVLTEVSSLLQKLHSQQYSRLANSDAMDPTGEEISTYEMLRDRLSSLIACLPPHIIATIDGIRGSELMVSKRLPSLNGMPTFTGSLPLNDPNTGARHQPQIQAAAMTAMNAAAGLSPSSPAPVASMLGGMSPVRNMLVPGTIAMRHATPQRVQAVTHIGNITVGSSPPSMAYQQPASTPNNYRHPQYPTTGSPHPHPHPHHQQQQQLMATPTPSYVVPQRQFNVYPNTMPSANHQHPSQQHQHPQHHQRPRGNVPPPQGLGAVGVGGGYSSPVVYSSTPRRR